MDVNGNGQIDYYEFSAYMSQNSSAQKQAEEVSGTRNPCICRYGLACWFCFCGFAPCDPPAACGLT